MTNWAWHDMHVHTRPHSPDAHWRAGVRAMLKKGRANGVFIIGLANHYFPTTNFAVLQKLRQKMSQSSPRAITVLVGAEACVLNAQGETIITPKTAAQLDFVLAGPHHFKQRWVETPPTGNAEQFVAHQHQMLLNAVKNPLINGLAHPWVINIQRSAKRWGFEPQAFLSAFTESHFAELGQAAAKNNTALEIGMGIHLMAQYQGEEFWQKYQRGLQAAKASGAKFYFGSDAHHLHIIARLDWLEPTLQKLGFTPGDIISPLMWAKNRPSS